jgi:predicted metal-dependent phosphoesterase TrpH
VPESRSFVDLHTHSRVSFDSLADPRRMVERALRLGLTHLAITDHERIDGAVRAAELAEASAAGDGGGGRLQVIIGEEVGTRDGDLIGLFLRQAVPPGLSGPETAAAIREQGGLVGLPHPFDRYRSSGGTRAGGGPSLAGLVPFLDYVEVHNARAYRDANPRAAAFAREHGLPGVASSDAHSVMELGIATTVLPEPFSTAHELRTLLAQATWTGSRTAFVLRLWTPLAKLVQRARGNRRPRPQDVAVAAPERP